MTRGAALALALALAGCTSGLDPSRTIQLVPDPAWSARDRATLAAAAECWTLQFGVPFAVVARATARQVVTFDFDPLACWQSWGRYLPGQPPHDAICPIADMTRSNDEQQLGYKDAALPFTVMEHELGHALNIPDASSQEPEVEQYAVMIENHGPSDVVGGTGAGVAYAFTPYDADQLAAANPGFAPAPACPHALLRPDPTTGVTCACP